MKKFIIFLIVAIAILFTTFMVLSTTKSSELRVSFSSIDLKRGLDLDLMLKIQGDETEFDEVYKVSSGLDAVLVEQLENDKYKIGLYINNILYSEQTVKVENNDLFNNTKTFNLEFVVDSLININSVNIVGEDLPVLVWNSEGFINPDFYDVKVDDKSYNVPSGTTQFNLYDYLDIIFIKRVKEITLEGWYGDIQIFKQKVDISDFVYDFSYNYRVIDDKHIEFGVSSKIKNENISNKIINKGRILDQSTASVLMVDLNDIYMILKDEMVEFSVLTEYDTIKISEWQIQIPVYVYKFTVEAAYKFDVDELTVHNSFDGDEKKLLYTINEDDEICFYSFEKVNELALKLELYGEVMYDSSIELNSENIVSDKVIKLKGLQSVDIETVQVSDDEVKINLKENGFIGQKQMKPEKLYISLNNKQFEFSYATSIVLENETNDDIHLVIQPEYFKGFMTNEIQRSIDYHRVFINIPEDLNKELLTITVNGHEIEDSDGFFDFYNIENKKNVEVTVEYEGKELLNVEKNLVDSKDIEVNVFSLNKFYISNVSFTDELVELDLTLDDSSENTIVPEYFWIEHENGDRFKSEGLSVQFDNTDASEIISIIPVYKNGIEGEAYIYKKPEKLKFDFNHPEISLGKYSNLNFKIVPESADYSIELFQINSGNREKVNVKIEDNVLVVPLSDEGLNHFTIVVSDENGQKISRDFAIDHVFAPEILLEEITYVGDKIIVRWNQTDFYDSYTITIHNNENQVEIFETEYNLLELSGEYKDFSISLVGNYKNMISRGFSKKIKLSDFIYQSSIDYKVYADDAKKMAVDLEFNNFEHLVSFEAEIYDSLGNMIENQLLSRAEFEGINSKRERFDWEIIPGEVYNIIFNYTYAFQYENTDIVISLEKKSLNINALRPEEIVFESIYQMDRNTFFSKINDFGKNINYQFIFKKAEGEEEFIYNSNSLVNEIKFNDIFKDYYGKLILNLKVFDLGNEKLLAEKEVKLKKVDADVYLSNSVISSDSYRGKTICLLNKIDVSNYRTLNFERCTLLFEEGASFDLLNSEINLMNATITSNGTSDELPALFNLEKSKLNISNSHVSNAKKLVYSSRGSLVYFEHSFIQDVEFPIESYNGSVKLDDLIAVNSLLFIKSMSDKVIVSNCHFTNARSVFTLGDSKKSEIKDVLFDNVANETIRIYDSEEVYLSNLDFKSVKLALIAKNTDLFVDSCTVNDSQTGFILSNLDFIAQNLLMKNLKNGISLSNSFSQIINSNIEVESIALYYENRSVKHPKRSFDFYKYLNSSSIEENEVVSVIHNTTIKAGTAIEIGSGEYNVVFKGIPPNGKIVHGGNYYDGYGNIKQFGRVIYIKSGELLDDDTEYLDTPETPEVPDPVEDIENDDPFFGKYQKKSKE